ncbi:Nitrate/TMAO reductases, membrane-bound tetraheme cytochrome c subunit [Olavius algarvensis associated proteobacterium Delta 3]|nr:Nitrate/TMAO reductases, membrane-bound tetraheme cytochrome c subunit [Olavius algarvensis associated proteobacterium Delta 3]
MKKWIIGGLLVLAGVAISFPLFSMSYYTMVRTSTPEFCASCHEIKPAVRAWRSSTHANNSAGIVVDCMDCHLPAPQDTYDFFFAKTYHGVKDVAIHFIKGEYDREKAQNSAYASFDNDQCQKCHRNLLHMPDKRGAMLAHRSVLHARPGYEKKCIDCHYDLVHNDKQQVMFRQYRRLPYQAKGLRTIGPDI